MALRRMIPTVAIVAAATTVLGASPQPEATARSLYQRIGGFDAIAAAVVNDFNRRWDEDPQLKPFIIGFSTDTGKRQVQMFIEFFCEQAGGPCTYLGRDMRTAHEGLVITEAQVHELFDKFSKAIDETLDWSRKS